MVNVLLAGGISMVLSLVGTPLFVRFLVRRGYGQFIRDDLTQHHYKRGKPTMGGALIIGAALAGYFGSHLALMAVSSSGIGAVTPGGSPSAPSWYCSSWSGWDSWASWTTT